MKPVVIIGFAEALSGPEVLWSLVDAGLEVKAFGRKGKPSALRHSRYCTVTEVSAPENSAAASTRDIVAIVNSFSNRPVVLFPLDDSAVWVCNQVMLTNPSAANAKVFLAGPSEKQTALALDKRIQIQVAQEAGFNVPATKTVDAKAEALQIGDFPMILKPAEAVVSDGDSVRKSGGWICGSKNELERAVNGWNGKTPLMSQPYIVGVGEGVFGMAIKNRVVAWSAHRRVRMMNPHGSGSSACASKSVPDDVKSAAEKFIEISGWNGLFMIELLRDATGKPWFMEFNGRPWGSIALARRRGYEYPAWNVRLAMDLDWQLTTTPHSSREIICRNAGRELMHPLFVLKGPKSKAITQWPGFLRTLFEIAKVNRRHCLYNWRRDDARVFLSDILYTLRGNIFKPRRAR